VSRDSEDKEDDEVTRAAQKRLEHIIHSSQFVRILWFATVGVCTVMRADRTLEPFQTPGVFARWQHDIVGRRLTELLLYIGRFNNRLPPYVNRGVHYLTAPKAPTRREPRRSEADGRESSPGVELGSSREVEALELSPSSSSPAPRDNHLADLQAFSTGSTFNPANFTSKAASSDPEPLDPRHARTVLVDTSHRVFNVDCLFPQYTDEWAIPLEHAASAIRAMRDWLEEEERLRHGERIHFPVEIRFADGDGIWMSHCQGRKTCFIGLTKYRPYDRPVRYRALFNKFEILMRHYAGRPHWAKAHSCGPVELQSLYPHLQDYLGLLKKVDPNGVFRNPYIRRHLYGQITDDASPRIFKSRL
jgi:L-gulonolactone oxidase